MPTFLDDYAAPAAFERPFFPTGEWEGAPLAYFRELGARRRVLFLAFAPKSASTFLREAATNALGGRHVRVVQALGGRDAHLYLPYLIECFQDPDERPAVTNVHMQAFVANRNLIEAFDLKPVIMIRSIPDMLASYWDMLDNEPHARPNSLNCFIRDDFPDLGALQKADFMIDVLAPWYASYYATWNAYAAAAPERVLVLHYNAFREKPAENIHAAIGHAGFSIPIANCEEGFRKAWDARTSHRYSFGMSGRGAEYFSRDHFDRLARLLSHYKHLDAWMPELLA